MSTSVVDHFAGSTMAQPHISKGSDAAQLNMSNISNSSAVEQPRTGSNFLGLFNRNVTPKPNNGAVPNVKEPSEEEKDPLQAVNKLATTTIVRRTDSKDSTDDVLTLFNRSSELDSFDDDAELMGGRGKEQTNNEKEDEKAHNVSNFSLGVEIDLDDDFDDDFDVNTCCQDDLPFVKDVDYSQEDFVESKPSSDAFFKVPPSLDDFTFDEDSQDDFVDSRPTTSYNLQPSHVVVDDDSQEDFLDFKRPTEKRALTNDIFNILSSKKSKPEDGAHNSRNPPLPRSSNVRATPNRPFIPPSSCGGAFVAPSSAGSSNQGSRSVTPRSSFTVPHSSQQRNVEYRFPSCDEVLTQTTPKRCLRIPVSFDAVSHYKLLFKSVLNEHINVMLFQVSAKFHAAVQRADISALMSGGGSGGGIILANFT